MDDANADPKGGARGQAQPPWNDQQRTAQASQEGLLFGPSVVRLFGTVFDPAPTGAFSRTTAPQDVRKNLLAPDDPNPAPKLARIYGVGYEGRYIPQQPPALFLVYGEGVVAPQPGQPHALAILGFAQQIDSFSNGLKVWAYDRNEVTSRIDHTSGTLGDLLGAPPAGVPGGPPRRPDILSGQDGNLFGRAGRLAI